MQALVVDDSAVYRKLIGDHLRSWDFGVTLAETGSEAWQILEQKDAPKLVLLDWVLPDLEGIDLCRRIRKGGSSRPYVYVILLTSNEGRQNMLDAMQAGADDFLVKPFDELELKARLLVGKRILDLQDELVSARESMRHAATHDSLTGLLNRGASRWEWFSATSIISRASTTPSAIFLAMKRCGKSAGDCALNSASTTALAGMAEKNFLWFSPTAICPTPWRARMRCAKSLAAPLWSVPARRDSSP